MRISELESENSKLIDMLQKNRAHSPNTQQQSMEKILKQNSSSKHTRNYTLNDREVDDMVEEEVRIMICL